MKSFFLACVASLGLTSGSALALPVISEFVADNASGLLDQDGFNSDWIEIHNPDATAVDLAGWSLTDNPTTPTKWTFPSVTIQPGGYLIVFASSKNRAVEGQELHTNFALSANGEYLALVQPGGAVASEFAPGFPAQREDVSYGIAKTAVTQNLVATVTPSILIPEDAGQLPASWNQVTTTGGTWIAGDGPGAIGYDTGTVPGSANIASLGVATQSTTLGGFAPQLAIDGGTGNFTHTNSANATPWWQLVFPAPQPISKVVLFNRGGGCCPERLRNITVELQDAAGVVLYTSPVLNPDNALNGPATLTVDIHALTGSNLTASRVRVTRAAGGGANADDNNVLSLGEVEVFAAVTPTVNVARTAGTTATQVSTLATYTANLAIDGSAGNFTHNAGGEANPWWQVTLSAQAAISNIVLFNRPDCCPERLSDITVEILNAADVVQWTSPTLNPGNAMGGPGTILVDVAALNGGTVNGTKVKVTRTGIAGTILSLGEVHVNAVPPSTYNAALTAGTAISQSSELGGYPAGNAIDNNLGNFTHTSGSPADANPWLQLALPNDVTIASLVVRNRGDGCCPERLRNFTVDILDQADAVVWTSGLLNVNNANPQAAYTLDLLATFPTGATGRKVKITRTGGGGSSDHDSYTLSIGELQVNAFITGAFDSNLATSGVATTSTAAFPAANGNNNNFTDFTHTAGNDVNPTWTLDLGGRKLINSVTLYNRTNCCGSRLRDITVTIRDTDNATIVYQSALLNAENAGYSYPSGPGEISLNIAAAMGGAVAGRYVEVRRTVDPDLSGSGGQGDANESNVLSLGEVIVMGRAFDTYLPIIVTDLKDEMQGKNTGAFVRYPFTASNIASMNSLKLRVRNDDGFDAYINGTKVAIRRSVDTGSWNAGATSERNDIEGMAWEEIDISSAIALLTDGPNNVLAIQGLTSSLTDTDFLLHPQLVADSIIVNATASYLGTPTPGAENFSPWFLGWVADTSFSLKRGFYATPQTVTLSTLTPDAQIYYSTNGEEPEAGSGTLYDGNPIAITQTTVLRVRAFKTNFQPTNVDTNTYIFLDDVLGQAANGQAPAGWPASWGANAVNYGMDPDIRSLYGDTQMKEALTQIPTVSVVTEMGHLFNPTTGIYANASGHGDAWERPASFEWLDPTSPEGLQGKVQQNFGLRIRGGASRGSQFPKHSFRAYFRGEYGAGKLNFPIFGTRGTTEHDVIDLASSQNYSWQNGDANDTMVRDPFSRETLLATGSPACRNQYFHLYLNGLYWGLYYFDERVSAGYGEAYFGGDKDDYDVIKTGNHNAGFATEATSGYLTTQPLPGGGTTTAAWKLLWDKARALAANPSEAAYFEILGKNPDGTRNPAFPVLVDETSLIDYLLTIFYTGDGDAPLSSFLGNERANNWFTLRSRVDNNQGFTFYTHDAEHTLGASASQNDRTGPWPSNPAAATNQNNFAYSNPQWLFQDLCNSAEFRLKVADRAHRHFFNNGVMTTGSAQARIDSLSGLINNAVKAHAQRWGDTQRAVPYNATDWANAVLVARNWLNGRSDTVVQQLRNYRVTSAQAVGSAPLYPNVVAPSYNQHGGDVAMNFNLTMSSTDVPAGAIYYTTDGTDPRAIGGTAVGTLYSGPVVLSATRTVKSRTLLAGAWSAMTEATFAVEVQDATATNIFVSELHYNPRPPTTPAELLVSTDPDSFEFIELTNLGTTDVDLSGCVFDGITYLFPSGSIFPAGARIILAKNPAAFAARYGASPVPFGEYGGKLSNDGETITLTSPLGAVIATVTYVNGGASDGGGPSLVFFRPEDGTYGADHQRPSIQEDGNPGATDSLRFSGNPTADADGDGYNALMEYALGTSDSNAAQFPAMPTIVKHSAGEIEVHFTYQSNADDVIFTPSGSPDLAEWHDARTLAPTTEIINGASPGAKVMVIKGVSAIANDPHYFYRIKVTERTIPTP